SSFGDGGATSFTSDAGRRTRRQNTQLQEVAIHGAGEDAALLRGVHRADIVVVHRLVNVGDEGVRNQQIINGDDHFIVGHSLTHDFITRNVVTSGSLTNHREGGGFAVLDVPRGHIRENLVVLREGGQDFTRVHLQEKSLGVTGQVSLTKAGYSSVCHLLFCE